MSAQDAQHEARQALLDGEVREIRHECLERLSQGLDRVGTLLRLAGGSLGRSPTPGLPPDPHLIGLGYVAASAASLSRGVLALHDAGNAYAAAALTRQLVETEYLGWAFAEDQAEAGAWLQSSKKDRISRWQPRHIRERSRGRFRGTDYQQHCEKGGHPTPDGCRFFFNDDQEVRCAGILVDALLHGRSTWRYLMAAVETHADTIGMSLADLLPEMEGDPLTTQWSRGGRSTRSSLTSAQPDSQLSEAVLRCRTDPGDSPRDCAAAPRSAGAEQGAAGTPGIVVVVVRGPWPKDEGEAHVAGYVAAAQIQAGRSRWVRGACQRRDGGPEPIALIPAHCHAWLALLGCATGQ